LLVIIINILLRINDIKFWGLFNYELRIMKNCYVNYELWIMNYKLLFNLIILLLYP
jgi:hypothetical protein